MKLWLQQPMTIHVVTTQALPDGFATVTVSIAYGVDKSSSMKKVVSCHNTFVSHVLCRVCSLMEVHYSHMMFITSANELSTFYLVFLYYMCFGAKITYAGSSYLCVDVGRSYYWLVLLLSLWLKVLVHWLEALTPSHI